MARRRWRLAAVVLCAAAAASCDAATAPAHVPDGRSGFQVASAATDWLARHQQPDGSWRSPAPCGRCDGGGEGKSDPVGETSLALLALCFTSPDPFSSRKGPTPAMRALEWLVAATRGDGSFDPALAPQGALDQALATLALGQALRFELRRVDRLARVPAERALDHLLSLRAPGGGWSRSGDPGASADLVTTTWATLAVGTGGDEARLAAIREDVLAWLDTRPGGTSESAAAMRTCCRIWLGATQRDPHLLADEALLAAYDADPTRPGRAADVAGRYFVMRASSWWGGRSWGLHRTRTLPAIAWAQCGAAAGCGCGSWEPGGGATSGRLETTALLAMHFDAYYISSYANVRRARGPLIPK